jgi:hypothetical protein
MLALYVKSSSSRPFGHSLLSFVDVFKRNIHKRKAGSIRRLRDDALVKDTSQADKINACANLFQRQMGRFE